MQLRSVVVGLVAIALGIVLGQSVQLLNAQESEREQPAGPWRIHHGPYGGNENSFYVLKINQVTGETWVLDARQGAEDDEWFRPPKKEPGNE